MRSSLWAGSTASTRSALATMSATMILVLGVAMWGQTAQRQAGPQQTASPVANRTPQALISGRVVDDESGAPVPNARVTMSATGVGVPVVLADQQGRFSLLAPTGRHLIIASKTGYTKREVAATAGSAVVEIRLPRGASISGRVTDESGDPGVGFRVRADTRSARGSHALVADTYTDDRGEYRIGGLASATVFVSVVPNTATFSISGTRGVVGDGGLLDPLFYPGVGSIDDAQGVVVRSGEERSGIDFLISKTDTANDQVADRMEQVRNALVASQPDDQTVQAVHPTAVVRGRVVDRAGRPLARAQVKLSFVASRRAGPLAASTDRDGHFEFRELAAGAFRLSASKVAYFSNSWIDVGPMRSPSFELKEGETRDDLEIRLDRWGTVEGRVVDERGDPMVDAVVQLLHARYEAGRRSLVRVDIPAPKTDDRGRFRLYRIPSGQYLVSAVVNDVSSAELPGYARGYYPGTIDPASAQYISVAAGADVAGADVALARARTARISGKLLDVNGRPTMGGSVLLVPSGSVVGESVGARIERNGDFEFVNVPPGQYVIQVYRGRLNGFTEGDFAAVPVNVGSDDVTGLVVRAATPSTIAGRITFNAFERGKIPTSGLVDIYAMPTDPLRAPLNGLASANIHADWTFELAGITGTRRLQMVRVPVGWAVEAVRVDGVDITDRPLAFGGAERSLHDVEIVLTDRIATLAGTVTDDRSRPLPGAGVIVYSTESTNWYAASRFLRRTTAGANGAFTVNGLPSGSYNVAAVNALPADGQDAWQDPEYLDALSARSSKVPITEGLPATVRLRVVSP